MKKSTLRAVVCAVAAVGSLMVQQTSTAAIYAPTKDTMIVKNGASPLYGSSATFTRFAKGGDPYWDCVNWIVLDFNRPTILSDISAAIGHTATLADFGPGGVTLKLNVKLSGDFYQDAAPTTYSYSSPAVLQSTSDWSEANANFFYADSVALTPWKNQSGTNMGTSTNGGLRQLNSALANATGDQLVHNLTATQVSPANTYTTFVLEPTVAWDFLTGLTPSSPSTPLGVAGLELLAGPTATIGSSNIGGYFKENATTTNRPFLEVTVPEPAILGMVAMSSLLFLRRRRVHA